MPSEFVACAIRPYTNKPVHVIPHPVATSLPGVSRKKDFGISAEKFTALCMFSFSSTIERKNPISAIHAFRTAFGDDKNVQLIVKCSDAHQYPKDAALVMAAIGNSPNIRLWDAILDRLATRDLIASVDVVLSLHRAEGFGLVMAEAMHAGTAVIATNWSGNLDFMDAQSAGLVSAEMVPSIDTRGIFDVQDQVLAEPNVAEAARWLKRMSSDVSERRTMEQRALHMVGERLGLEAFRMSLVEALMPIAAPAE